MNTLINSRVGSPLQCCIKSNGTREMTQKAIKRGMDKLSNIHTVEYYSAIKNKLLIDTTQGNLKSVKKLSLKRQRENSIYM